MPFGRRFGSLGMLSCLGLALATAGCPAGQSKEDDRGEQVRKAQQQGQGVDSEQDGQAGGAADTDNTDRDGDACLGTLTPPRGAGGATYLQETAVVGGEDVAAAQAKANRKLRDRLCNGFRCQALADAITGWEVQQGGGYACARAVVKEADYEAWERENAQAVQQGLRRAARQLVEAFGPAKSPTLAIRAIRDHQIGGGLRAQWLYDRMQRALLEAGAARVMPFEHHLFASETKERVDGIINGRIYPLKGVETMLEVTWKLDSGSHGADPVKFPASLAPDVDEATYLPELPEGDGSVELHFDTLPGGSLCHGQKTELWLKSSERLHVRVIDLYGRDGGLVIYPTEDQPSVVQPGAMKSLGEFMAVKTGEIPVERFLVLAAADREDLGAFADSWAPCRLPSTVAANLQRGASIPPEARKRLATESYRIIEDAEQCAEFMIAKSTVERMKSQLDGLATCWSEDGS